MVRRSSSLDRSSLYSSGAGGSNLASTVTSSLATHWSKSSGGPGIHGAGSAGSYDYSAKSGIVSGVEPLSRTYLGSRVPILTGGSARYFSNGVGSGVTSTSNVTKYKYDAHLGGGRGGSRGFKAFVAPEIPNFPPDDEDEVDIRRRVRQRFKKAHSAEPSSVGAMPRTVISGKTSDMVKMRDRIDRSVRTGPSSLDRGRPVRMSALSLDRDRPVRMSASVDRDWGPWQADGSAQVHGRTQEVYSYQINEPRVPPPTPLTVTGMKPRAMSVEPLYYTSDLDLDPPSTRLNVIPVHARAASLTRVPMSTEVTSESAVIRRGLRRVRSATDLDDEEWYDDDTDIDIPKKRITKKKIPMKVPIRSLHYEAPEYIPPFTDKDVQSIRGDYRFHISELEKDRRKGDISTYVLPHDEKFEPDDIVVTPIGDGKKQVTYSRQTLSGHANDPREAKAALDNVVRRTKFMQDSMTELEKFVRRNRSLFPEDTTIYQDYKYYLLSEEELAKIGEPRDAEIYGVKIIEKLVVPAGTEIAHLLKRFYGKSDVEVEYSRRRKAPPVEDESGLVDHKYLRDNMRKKVELEFESRGKGNGPSTRYLPTYQSPIIRDVDFKDYAHLYTRITPRHLKKIYGEPGEG